MSCLKCRNICDIEVVQFVEFARKKSSISYYCPACFESVHSMARVTEMRRVLVGKKPEGATLVIAREPKLVQREDMTVWAAASQKENPADEVIDNTIHANRESWADAQIGSEVLESPQLKTRDEVRGFLNTLRNAEILLPGQEDKKLLNDARKIPQKKPKGTKKKLPRRKK